MTDSPYLPSTNIQYAWDSTSIGYIKTCPRLYQYIMLEGWSPKDNSVHLRFGQEYHQAIQDYDTLRASSEAFEPAVRKTIWELLARTHDWDVDESTKAGGYKNRKNLLTLVVDYLDFYRDDPAQTFILQNGKPAVELSFRFELGWGPEASSNLTATQIQARSEGRWKDGGTIQKYLLCGHLDRVVSYADSLFVLDHKTTTTAPGSYFFASFDPNNQMTLYTIAGQVVIDSPVRGVIVEAAQILLDKPSRFVRDITYRTQDRLDEWIEDLHHWFALAEHYATQDYFPQNDTACDKFGGCKFRDVCSKSPHVRETYLKADFIKLEKEDRWNPLKPR